MSIRSSVGVVRSEAVACVAMECEVNGEPRAIETFSELAERGIGTTMRRIARRVNIAPGDYETKTNGAQTKEEDGRRLIEDGWEFERARWLERSSEGLLQLLEVVRINISVTINLTLTQFHLQSK